MKALPSRFWQWLTPDGRLLFTTRVVRLFAYGFLSIVLALYLAAAGLSEAAIGLLLSLTLMGDTAISLWLTTHADRAGRRRTLIAGAMLMVLGGVVFALTRDAVVLMLAAIVGVISPSGNEVGPFLPVEQAALSQTVPGRDRTRVFAWYNLAGSLATAVGAFAAGALAQVLQATGAAPVDSYRVVVLGYAGLGLVLALLFTRLSSAAEAPIRAQSPAPDASARRVATAGGPDDDPPAPTARPTRFGLHQSQGVVARLAALFALDAFAGGFVVQSLVAYWFHIRFGVEPAVLGSIFLGANVLAGISALTAARLAARIGLINTMVFTHIPSNILLMLVPLMPSLPLAVAVLLLRFSISQMDVPTRQSYTMAVVSPDERSAAAGVTGVARTIGASLSPLLAGPLLAQATLAGTLFLLAGGLKIVYDLLLYRGFRTMPPPEEEPAQA